LNQLKIGENMGVFRQAPAPAPKVALAKPPAKAVAAKVAAVPKVMPAVAVEMVELEDQPKKPGDSWTK